MPPKRSNSRKPPAYSTPSTEGEDPGTRLNSYNLIKQEIMSGTDTYWLSKPLRVGFQHKHSLIYRR